MAIELGKTLVRKNVAWLKKIPPEDGKKAFEDRGYGVTSCSEIDLEDPAYLSGLAGVIFTQNDFKPLQIASDLERLGRLLLDHDCRVVLRPIESGISIVINMLNRLMLPVAGLPEKEANQLRSWRKFTVGDPPSPNLQYVDTGASWSDVANLVADCPSGPAPNRALKIVVDERVNAKGKRCAVVLSDQETLLLQRAFADCSDLHLTPLDGGRSGVSVYRACAELTGGLFGKWPQPYFVKIGKRGKVIREYEIYVGYVGPYVPFHLGPHLVRDRCFLSATEGVIVGNYVEESESLRYCAYDGRSASAIACLFDRTLLGWHRQASKVDVSLSAGLLHRFPQQIEEKRMKRARSLGAKKNIVELRALFELCTAKPTLAGPIHGDLHAANVRVRAADAIVIDFLAYRIDPLLFDAATLEASLLVEGFPDREKNCNGWLRSVESLYDHSPLDNALMPANPKSKAFWFHASVLQIRRYARQWQCGPNQYAAALALALLIKAKKDPDALEPEASRRAAAYLFAERILLKAFGISGAAKEEQTARTSANAKIA